MGDICGTGRYLKCPVIKGPKQPCGAHYRAGVACGRKLHTGKCPLDHTPINDLTKENQLIWFDHIAAIPDLDFNEKVVTCFKRVAGAWVRLK